MQPPLEPPASKRETAMQSGSDLHSSNYWTCICGTQLKLGAGEERTDELLGVQVGRRHNADHVHCAAPLVQYSRQLRMIGEAIICAFESGLL